MASAAEQLAANLNFGAFSEGDRAAQAHLASPWPRWSSTGSGPTFRFRASTRQFAAQVFQGQSARHPRHVQHVLGRRRRAHGHLRPERDAVHLGLDHRATADGTVYPPWEKLRKEGGEAGRKTLNQYTRYLTVVPGLRPGLRHRLRPGPQLSGLVDRTSRRHVLHRLDGRHPDGRHHVPDVAGRADHQPRRRQRHQPDHLRRHRRGSAAQRLATAASSVQVGARSAAWHRLFRCCSWR
jgi:hypothetical protein